MSTISSPSSTTTATTTTTTASTPIRLPSINELTSRSNTSPRLSVSDSSKLLPSISASVSSANITSPFKYQPLKPTTQSNYILHNATAPVPAPMTANSSTSINTLPKLTSPALPQPQQQQQQLPPASSISPVNRLINTPPQQSASTSASTSPNSHYQYYQYPQQQQSPIMHPQQQQQQQYPQPAYYQQPVYYQGATAAAAAAPGVVAIPHHQQYPQNPTPEVINKPINKCHRCGTTETPEWRRGPKGVRTLCNACGLFHAKLVKRKGAALAAEEVLNNKVTKGKNGRRISIKKHLLNECLKNKTNTLIQPTANTPNGAPHYYAPQPQPQPQQQQQHPIHPIAVVGHHQQPQGIALPPPVHFNNGMMIPIQPQVIPVYQNGPVPLIRN